MGLGPELTLMALAAALYLYDSSLLLEAEEGILMARGRGWIAALGSKILVRGRELYLPNPLLPHRPMFRLDWSALAGDTGWTAQAALFGPLKALVWGMALSLFVFLPLTLFLRLGDVMVLLAIGVLYVFISLALIWVTANRKKFNVNIAMLAVESLLCAPFALNLVRKLSLAMPAKENFAQAARRLLRPEDWEESRRQLLGRLDEELEAEDEDSERARALRAFRGELAKEGAAA